MRRVLAALVLALAAAGCATTDTRVVLREMQDISSRAPARPVAKVAVVTIESDAAKRRAWDDAFAARLTATGVATTTRDGLPGAASLDADATTVDGAGVIDAARRAGADAILFVQPPSDAPVTAGRGAYRWMDARSNPDPRTDLDTTPASVTEVRLYGLGTGMGGWRAMVLVYYPAKGTADAAVVANSVVGGLTQRGFLAVAPR
jgi:hypothetical protein